MTGSILDGTGKGNRARVDGDGRLSVNAIATSFQHLVAHTNKNGYQIIATGDIVDGTTNVIHIKNIDPNNLDLIPIRIRTQLFDFSGGSSLPNSDNYFSITLEETHDSGGSTAIPINTTAGSTKLSTTLVHINNPTLSGAAKGIERCYPTGNGNIDLWNTDGVLIIPPGNTMNIRYIGDQTSGSLYASVLFVMNRIN